MAEKQKIKKKLAEEIEVPSNINATLTKEEIIMKKDNEEVRKKLNKKIKVELQGNKIILGSDKSTKKEKKLFGSMIAHINNMIEGLNTKFKYKLQVASVHFPVTLTHDKNTNELIVKNFLGERKERKIKLIPGVDIKINKDIIEVESASIEKAGQVAADIEKGTKVRNRDRRIFQDGIFITEKPGRVFL
ncbi:50S ribosomal protein L6 [uncultured archaeon]|nr:50S ribosomal protein L6 [uncultured archaeon]